MSSLVTTVSVRTSALLLAAAAVVVVAACSLSPFAGLGPVTASNHSGESVVIKLATIDGAWQLAPGQRITFLSSHSTAVNEAYLLTPDCTTVDTATLPDTGSVHLTIGAGPTIASIENVDQPDIAPAVPAPDLCP
jgi:hypothetical protein